MKQNSWLLVISLKKKIQKQNKNMSVIYVFFPRVLILLIIYTGTRTRACLKIKNVFFHYSYRTCANSTFHFEHLRRELEMARFFRDI